MANDRLSRDYVAPICHPVTPKQDNPTYAQHNPVRHITVGPAGPPAGSGGEAAGGGALDLDPAPLPGEHADYLSDLGKVVVGNETTTTWRYRLLRPGRLPFRSLPEVQADGCLPQGHPAWRPVAAQVLHRAFSRQSTAIRPLS